MAVPKDRRGQARRVMADYFRAGSRYPKAFCILAAGVIILELAGLGGPLLIKQFIDGVASGDASDAAVAGLLGLLAAYAGVGLVGWIGRRMQFNGLERMEADVMTDLYDRAYTYLMGHSHAYFTKEFSGTLQRRVSKYAQSFETVLDIMVFGFVSTAIFAAGVVIVLAQRNLWLGLGLLAWTVLFVWLQFVMTKWHQPLRLARAEEESRMTGILADSIGNQGTVSLFAAERHERSLVLGALGRWKAATLKSWDADQVVLGVQGLLAIAIELAILAGAVLLWKQGLITVGDFVLVQVYVLALIERVWGIGRSSRRLYTAFADADEMIGILQLPHAIQDAPDASELRVSAGTVSFSAVSFGFEEGRPVLQDFDLSVPAGQKVALVGPSGAGKSTVTKLLLRQYDADSGSVSIDNQDIRAVTQESLRRAISYVPQEPILFHRSLMENIRYGRPDASEEEIIEAAKKARCHEFITALPEGYESLVGERGVKLSGGERQRVAIARAILKDAPILVLDEATSALDSESESLIQDALRVLMEGKTVIVIAHRLSTIMAMDRIVVIEGGRIVAEGTHDELVAGGGLYQKLWSIQAGSFRNDTTP